MARVTGGGAGVSVDKIVKFSNTVSSEEAQLKFLKNVLGTQVRKRIPLIFLFWLWPFIILMERCFSLIMAFLLFRELLDQYSSLS